MFVENCDRCGKKTELITCSMFNEEMICMKCKERERLHPKYGEAVRADHAEIKKGNYNFPGIGLPDDLAVSRNTEVACCG